MRPSSQMFCLVERESTISFPSLCWLSSDGEIINEERLHVDTLIRHYLAYDHDIRAILYHMASVCSYTKYCHQKAEYMSWTKFSMIPKYSNVCCAIGSVDVLCIVCSISVLYI